MSEDTTKVEEAIQNQTGTPVIFQWSIKELVKAKSSSLLKLRDEEKELINLKLEFAKNERALLLTTDFKAEGLTNEKMRNAFINEELKELKEEIEFKKLAIDNIKDDIVIINDLIRAYELTIEGE